jgi:hypothetical protein
MAEGEPKLDSRDKESLKNVLGKTFKIEFADGKVIGNPARSVGIKIATGTIVDATIIHAPSSTKNASGERDPAMLAHRFTRDLWHRLKQRSHPRNNHVGQFRLRQSVPSQIQLIGLTGKRIQRMALLDAIEGCQSDDRRPAKIA